MNQILLDLEYKRNEYSKDDYIISNANRESYDALMNFPKWPNSFIILHGDHGSGKTHLGKIWMEEFNAIEIEEHHDEFNIPTRIPLFIDNIDQYKSERKLLNLYNILKEQGNFLLMTTSTDIRSIALSDLRSRLLSIPLMTIQRFDDELIKISLVKQFTNKQITVSKEIIEYISHRIERSPRSAKNIVNKINIKSLESKKGISISFIKNILQEADSI